MKLKDPKKLARLMAIQEISGRQLARAAGWSSHTYLQRLLHGEVDTLKPAPAVAIAQILGVALDDLFVTKLDGESGQIDRDKRSTKVPA